MTGKIKRMINAIRNGIEIVPLMDLFAYFRLRSKGKVRPIRLRIRTIGNKYVLARTGTADFLTLYSVFHEQYHLPPATLSGNPVILDLGSNIGYTVVHYKYIYPDSFIIGAELDEGNYEMAKNNTSGLENIELIHGAISHKEDKVLYKKTGQEDAYHILNENSKHEPYNIVEVKSITIQSILSKYDLPIVDFVKMDIEGEEENIFDPDRDMSWLNKVKSLNIEVHGGADSFEKILSALKRYNFRAWKDDRHWSAILAVRQ